jgi:hydroxysqualene dehydroxylase
VRGGRLHVVGGGVAGLAAALAAARAGRQVALHEAAPAVGGRCRSVGDGPDDEHDNGTHVLLGANRAALSFLDAVGARASWIEPEPKGLPMVDLADGSVRRIGLSPWSWLDPLRRPPGLTPRTLLRLGRLGLPGADRPVAETFGTGSFTRAVIEPLTVAALNTPVAEASTRRLGMALQRIARPGAGRLLVARRGLGPDLIRPAVETLAGVGVVARCRSRLRALEVVGDRAERLVFADTEVRLGPGDLAVLALPPHALAKLLPHLALPDRHAPIVNLHFATSHPGPIRFAGVLGGAAQWVLFRPGLASVTISAARDAVAMPAAALATAIWREVVRTAELLGLPPLPAETPKSHVVKERRATVSQAAGAAPLPERRPFANVTLAGDWLSPLPATIEAAVASGVAAVGTPLVPRQRSRAAERPVERDVGVV